MPNRTYVAKEEKKLPVHKPMKDRLKILVCGNANGKFKVKLWFEYH